MRARVWSVLLPAVSLVDRYPKSPEAGDAVKQLKDLTVPARAQCVS